MTDRIDLNPACVATPESSPFISGAGLSLSVTPGPDPMATHNRPEQNHIGFDQGLINPRGASFSAHSSEGPPIPRRPRSPFRPGRHCTSDNTHPTSHRSRAFRIDFLDPETFLVPIRLRSTGFRASISSSYRRSAGGSGMDRGGRSRRCRGDDSGGSGGPRSERRD